MRDTGHITLWNVECIFVEENNDISIISKDKDKIKDFRAHFNDQNFILNYCGNIGYKCTAFIERVQFELNYAVKLFPKYIIKGCHDDSFDGFEMMGEAIDDFFSPSRYFYDRSKVGVETSVDFIYHNEVAEKWVITFEDKPVTITLSYGDIWGRGVASDLILHPKLKISFSKTTDVQYIYRMYLLIIRFLQIIRYDTKCGNLRIDLFSEENGKMSYNGRLYDFCANRSQFLKGYYDVEYGSFKPYIQRFLQFTADNPNYSFHHYPSDGIRFFGRDYSSIDYMNIFAAFESECHAKKDIYENADATRVQSVKDALIIQVHEYLREGLEQEETDFLNNAKDRISQLGTQFGQKRKIVNAYKILHNALDSSIEHIFYQPEFRLKGPLQKGDLNKIAGFLAAQRGAVAHGSFLNTFSDVDAQKIRFLEILTYSQLLKRVGLEDADIERVIGALFGCNFILFQEEYH
ncbi:hypothetical protein [Clostridium sp. E02]|uniref:hypothetical protein n=1 Tax=Clostridium sp. E02 TaxID=2487134 RepID=UPI000F526897|nr:hypothetical protein [Clostridium sp. E02]